MKYDAIQDYFFTKARNTSVVLSGVNKRHTVATITATFAANPYMSNGGVDIDLLSTETNYFREFILYKNKSNIDILRYKNGTIDPYNTQISKSDIIFSGNTGKYEMEIKEGERLYFRINPSNNEIESVNVTYNDVVIEPLAVNAGYFDFYVCDFAGTISFNFVFANEITQSSDIPILFFMYGVAGRIVIDELEKYKKMPITISVKGDGYFSINHKNNSHVIKTSCDIKDLFYANEGYNYMTINGNTGNKSTCKMKYKTLEEVL